MSLNHLLKISSNLPIKTKSVKTDSLEIKMGNGSYTQFILPNLGTNTQVLSTNGAGGFTWIDNNTISRLYYAANDIQSDFVTQVNVSDNFTLLRSGNFTLNNNTNKKVLLKLSFIYKWLNNQTPSDFVLKVFVNNELVYDNREGLSDYVNDWNKLNDQIILDIDNNDFISIRLDKELDGNSAFMIKKNSFFSIELL